MSQGKAPDPAIEFIDVIEPVLDNVSFTLALAGGVVIGIIALYAWQEYHRTNAGRSSTPLPVYEDDHAQIRLSQQPNIDLG